MFFVVRQSHALYHLADFFIESSIMHVLIIPSWYPEYPEDVRGCFFREQALALQKYGCKVGVIYPQLRSLKNWKSKILLAGKIS